MVMMKFISDCVIFSAIGTFILGLGRFLGLFHFAWYLSFIPFLFVPILLIAALVIYQIAMRNGGRG